MHRSIIPVDLRNPGQVFACLGFAETVEQIYGDYCEVEFAFQGREAATSFILSCERTSEPMKRVVEFLREAEVTIVIPSSESTQSHELSTSTWRIMETIGEQGFFPSPLPSSPATLPTLLRSKNQSAIMLSSWADGFGSGRDNLKFWGGAAGNPAAAIMAKLLQSVRNLSDDDVSTVAADPFSLSEPMTSSFRFDWRRDYVALDAGFSPNRHVGEITMVGYPLTEIGSAIGIQHARPQRIGSKKTLQYRYGVSNASLPLVFARPVLGTANLGFVMRTFVMRLAWANQGEKDRCIVDAYEEIL